MLTKIRAAASGWKTYVVAVLVILLGIAEGPLGLDVPGAEVGADWLRYILEGAGLAALRAAVPKAATEALMRF